MCAAYETAVVSQIVRMSTENTFETLSHIIYIYAAHDGISISIREKKEFVDFSFLIGPVLINLLTR